MAGAISLDATDSPDGKIEITVPQLAPWQRVHSVIEPQGFPGDQKRAATDILA